MHVPTAIGQQNMEAPTGQRTADPDRASPAYHTRDLSLELVAESQTVASLTAMTDSGSPFDFTPADWLSKRTGDGFHHLGDLNVRVRSGESTEWRSFSTATNRKPVKPLPAYGPVLAASDLAPTFADDFPLVVRRYWENLDGQLGLQFEITNPGDTPVEIGALGIPMVFNNILHRRTLEEAHALNVFYDPYIGEDAGYLQVTRLNGNGPALIVVPQTASPFEAYRPLLEDSTQTGTTFEGFYEWMVHSKAYAENEWAGAQPWNPPTSYVLQPGASRSYGVRFLVADSIRGIEQTLLANGRPVAVGVSGYVLPIDLPSELFLKSTVPIRSLTVEPADALTVDGPWDSGNGWVKLTVHGKVWGRARLRVQYQDGTTQAIHYKVIKSQADVVTDLGHFLTTEQWFDNNEDPFRRGPSVISYDYYSKRRVTEDSRAWIAGLGDEGGSGSWLAAFMKQLVQPDRTEIRKLEEFVDKVLWGRLQYAEGELKYGVRKSLFYYDPDGMPAGTYSDSIRYGGWSSWNEEHAKTVGRSYNYPHVAAAYWVLYRLARNTNGLVTRRDWTWYLRQAYETSSAMVRLAPEYAQFGQMEGTVFILILRDLQREGLDDIAAAMEADMKSRATVWRSLAFPFGSEMPWDSTGQEEVYGWCTYFGYEDKALATLNAILGYMPTVPHWGYNGSARRYWDFWYAGHPRYSRLERQLHHYGSGLNAIPVLAEYRRHPDDLYLLRVGYGGIMGAISNITADGFGPSGFHAYPSTLQIDGYSGDYGPNFFGHAVNVGAYLYRHPDWGWLAFGGTVSDESTAATIHPKDAARSRVFLAPIGLWLTLDAGKFESVRLDESSNAVTVTLVKADATTDHALLRIEQTALVEGVGHFETDQSYRTERGGLSIPLHESNVTVVTLIDKQQ